MQLAGQYNKPGLAVQVFSLMKRYGIQPDATTYANYNRVCIYVCYLTDGKQWRCFCFHTISYPCSQLIVIGCPKQIDDLFAPTSSVMCCDRWVTFFFSSVNRYLTCSGTLFGIEFSYIYVCFSGHNYSVWLICLIYLVITHVGSSGCENCPDFYYHLFVFKSWVYWINHTFRQLPRGREHLSV